MRCRQSPPKRDSSQERREETPQRLPAGRSGDLTRTPETIPTSSTSRETPSSGADNETAIEPTAAASDPARPIDQRQNTQKAHSLIDKVYSWKNLNLAWRKVRKNKGTHGLDRVTIRMFEADLERNLRVLQRQLHERRFRPTPTRRVYIPKASDPKALRPLSIPSVGDRVVQQALYQVLNPLFDPEFSERSFGARPLRSAHQAIETLIQDRKDGYRYVVDADIKSFFDCIDHEVAMSLIRQKVADGPVLDLLEAFLKNGISDAGTIHIPTEGAPQGGVVSPLISNIVLNELDKALEAKGWRFVRYVDDFVVLTRSREEATQALAYVKEVLQSLKLTLSEEKTRIVTPRESFDFLGFRIQTRSIAVRPKSLDRFKDKIRLLTRRQQGNNVDAVLEKLNPVVRGWSRYFGWGNVQRLFWRLDQWIRSRIRGFKFKRKCRNDNYRLNNRRIKKWGLLSLQQCRPTQCFDAGRAKLREGAGSPDTGNSRGAAQCGNTAC